MSSEKLKGDPGHTAPPAEKFAKGSVLWCSGSRSHYRGIQKAGARLGLGEASRRHGAVAAALPAADGSCPIANARDAGAARRLILCPH